MKHEKFVQDAKISPSRYYRNPGDIIRDRRLTKQDRLEILDAWERDMRNSQSAGLAVGETGESLIEEVRRLRQQIESEPESDAGTPRPRAGVARSGF